MEEVGWIDPWRLRNPLEKQFSCFSKTHMFLSRIDLCLCSTSASQYVEGIQYLPRSISDHSPLLLSLKVKPGTNLPRAPWKLNAFWLNLFPFHEKVERDIVAYWQRHTDHPDTDTAWDAFKAFLRGIFIAEVNAIKRGTAEQRDQVAQMVKRLEAEYIANSGEGSREAWLAAQDALTRIDASRADKKRFFSKMAFYEEGGQMGKLLAKLVQSQQASPSIGKILC